MNSRALGSATSARPFPVLRIEDFTPAQIALASLARGRYDVAFVFSTKYQPAHPLLEDWNWLATN